MQNDLFFNTSIFKYRILPNLINNVFFLKLDFLGENKLSLSLSHTHTHTHKHTHSEKQQIVRKAISLEILFSPGLTTGHSSGK